MDKRLLEEHTSWRPDQVELLLLLSHGLGNKEIASHFSVSGTAIKKRIGVLMKRLAVSNRIALVRAAFAQGLLTTDTDSDQGQCRLDSHVHEGQASQALKNHVSPVRSSPSASGVHVATPNRLDELPQRQSMSTGLTREVE